MRLFLCLFMASLMTIVVESARVKVVNGTTETELSSTRDDCTQIVAGSRRHAMAGLMARDSKWCTCEVGQRLMRSIRSNQPKTDEFCNGEETFDPRRLVLRGCVCRVPERFTCPEECWQCCGSGGISLSEQRSFKCVLKNEAKLPPRRSCSDPVTRMFDENTYKTQCNAEPWEELTLPSSKCETHSDFYKGVDWALEKLQEVPQLLFTGGSNLAEMGGILNYIHTHATVRKRFIPLSQLKMIHPVDTQPALVKTAKRAKVMRENLAVLKERGLKFSEDLANNHPDFKIMTSKEGFEVIQVASAPDRYVIMEGNGRLCGTRWAFPDNKEFREIRNSLQVEVNEHVLVGKQSEEAIKRITELRASYHTDAYEPLFPSSFEEGEVLAYWAKVWTAGVGANDELHSIL